MKADAELSRAGLDEILAGRKEELKEALEQQAATADILRVISASPTDAAPVFETIVTNTARLCEANFAFVMLHRDGRLFLAARTACTPEFAGYLERGIPISDQTTTGRAALQRRPVQVLDFQAESGVAITPAHRSEAVRTVLAVPMLRDNRLLGVIATWRREVRPFSDKQIRLLETFADQAVIAIENVRLFQELRARTDELTAANAGLSEALQHQTAASDILRVIASSPNDVQPVFDLIAERAARLCEAKYGWAYSFDGEWIHINSAFGMDPQGIEVLRKAYPMRPGEHAVTARAVRDGSVVNVADVLADPDYAVKDASRLAGFRGALSVPMLRDGQVVGAITVARAGPGLFSERQVELLKTFASQAVIAVENVRLFNALQERNRELAEALAHQTATSEILRVIAGSQEDVQPVFDAVAQWGARLCSAQFCAVFRFDGKLLHLVAHHNLSPDGLAAWKREFPMPPDRRSSVGRAVLDCAVAQVPEVDADADYGYRNIAEIVGFHSIVGVPLMREGKPVGALALTRAEAGFLPDTQLALLKTFADQAAIAMENVRLFQALRSRTEALTHSVEKLQALGEVGQAVNSSLDLQTVLTTIVSRAAELSGCYGGIIYEFHEATQTFHAVATHRISEAHLAALRATPVRLGEGAVGRAAATRAPVQVTDILDEAQPVAPQTRHILAESGFRSVLAIPLLREQRLLGGLVVWREAPGAFAGEIVALLQTFAAQSVLAIHNARLFQELQDKSQALQIADRHKSEFLANMSHELRTPLNAIIGFSEVLKERMFGELNPKQAEYVEDIHSSGRHLLSLINDILDLAKIEAGRMGLELSSFDLPEAIRNALVLVSERAARHGIRVEQDIDARLGSFEGDERKFKQILLNLLSNAVKFTPEGGLLRLRAMAREDSIEVSVQDTGTGIAPEYQELIFEEFRQVVPDGGAASEGTGLGLTLTRKFVELHGGRLWLESEPGKGSTFTFRLPVRP